MPISANKDSDTDVTIAIGNITDVCLIQNTELFYHRH
jgi:hypothetical protein